MIQQPRRLDHALGLWQVTASGVGIIIGAGVYVLIGSATALAGPRVWITFVAAALLSVLTGISYAELASMYARRRRVRVHPPCVPALGRVPGGLGDVPRPDGGRGRGRSRLRGYAGFFLAASDRVWAFVMLAFVMLVALGGIRPFRAPLVPAESGAGRRSRVVLAIGAPDVGQVHLLSGGGTGFDGVVAAAALVFFAFIGFDEVIPSPMKRAIRHVRCHAAGTSGPGRRTVTARA